MSTKTWWKEGIVYQIYPRSFQDTSGNGVGDLKGILHRLDYIKSLGVDIIWLNPVYESPNDDNGYDISDYRSIMKEFGSMEDFDALLAGMKTRGLKLVMDLVVNHSSDEHPWFKASRSSRDNPYRDYYHWWPAEKGIPPKRWSYFDVEENAWKYDATTDAYYLHYFSVKQPDLKWENPKVRQEIYQMMDFWFKKGVDGFRMDVIPFISKDTSFPELPEKYQGDFVSYYAEGPKLHEYLQEMNKEVLSKYDVMTVGEAPGVTIDNALDLVGEDRKELHMFFHFDLMSLDRKPGTVFEMNPNKWKLTQFKEIHSRWDRAFETDGWGSMFLSNHDFPRSVSRWGNDHPDFWHASATMLQTFLLTMRGTPYFYFGDEIGMTNVRFNQIEQYQDINTLNRYEIAKNKGQDLEAFLENEKEASRDNARTPMQWDTTENSGFSKKTPWISLHPNYKTGVNVASQEVDEHSVLHYFRKATALRKAHQGLIYGDYKLIDPKNEDIYAYTRSYEGKQYLILLSFSENLSTVNLSGLHLTNQKLLLANSKEVAEPLTEISSLHPYEARVYDISKK
ncbi:MAG: alpha-glucosidase [Flavobacteriaceae bacterium]|jgi:oligo-1,6-glucosidase|nr:alpha-glucosidase [Flavobacteriaceae bacterium]MCI5088390.1 alpha-glucosidase [Flavobacteriaceae bacterium]CAI8189482.1 MAG: Oligo-1,6-glucosidase [SAR116 cluster bacterium]